MPASLQLYRQAAQSAQASAWTQATTALQQAFLSAPPQQLTDDECRSLRPYLDDLTAVGQRLPSLTFTLGLLTRIRDLIR